MRLKTKLVLAITGLVFLVVTVLSWLFLEQLLAQRITHALGGEIRVSESPDGGASFAVVLPSDDPSSDGGSD